MMAHTFERYNTELSAQIAFAVEMFQNQSPEFKKGIYTLLHGNSTETRRASEALLNLVTKATEEEVQSFMEKHFPGRKMSPGDSLFRLDFLIANYFFNFLYHTEAGEYRIDVVIDDMSPEYRP